MTLINRKSYSSTIPADQQPGMNKVIVANLTARGYLHIVAVRTNFDAAGTPTESFTDVLVHPDRALNIDVAKFDAVSLSGVTPRNAPGEPKPNTQYVWASGAQAIGRHLVKRVQLNGKDALEYAGIGVYATATAPEPQLEPAHDPMIDGPSAEELEEARLEAQILAEQNA
jgi:hypothetical protein